MNFYFTDITAKIKLPPLTWQFHYLELKMLWRIPGAYFKLHSYKS